MSDRTKKICKQNYMIRFDMFSSHEKWAKRQIVKFVKRQTTPLLYTWADFFLIRNLLPDWRGEYSSDLDEKNKSYVNFDIEECSRNWLN